MNFHVIFVHFPIALLVVYSFFELLRFKKLKNNERWFYIKVTFLVTGVISAFPTLSSGEALEDLPKYDNKLLELHSGFASSSTNFFLVIAIIYILAIFYRQNLLKSLLPSLENTSKQLYIIITYILKLANRIVNSDVFLLAGIIGILLLVITGGLGGVLARGVGIDPVADFIYNLFF